jgi:hypothetical protein
LDITTLQQEVDYIEEVKGQLRAVEFRWNPDASARFPATFLNNYPKAKTDLVTPANRDQFLTTWEYS